MASFYKNDIFEPLFSKVFSGFLPGPDLDMDVSSWAGGDNSPPDLASAAGVPLLAEFGSPEDFPFSTNLPGPSEDFDFLLEPSIFTESRGQQSSNTGSVPGDASISKSELTEAESQHYRKFSDIH